MTFVANCRESWHFFSVPFPPSPFGFRRFAGTLVGSGVCPERVPGTSKRCPEHSKATLGTPFGHSSQGSANTSGPKLLQLVGEFNTEGVLDSIYWAVPEGVLCARVSVAKCREVAIWVQQRCALTKYFMTLCDAWWRVYNAQNTGQKVSQSVVKYRKVSQSVVKRRKVIMHLMTLHDPDLLFLAFLEKQQGKDRNPFSKKPFLSFY